ncbi:glycoside hydrolase family 43 [Tessaracoccus lapidicaptus]|uniref:Glycoside hydrolase family 43 n=1 Tax=Tessaracoccus lapidicaptus TaxID=1427523 RepID=A0A1C0AQJ7_9ACTN|nr:MULTISPECIES: LamG-like jellyroll fold domain-containing protein [Tessaracoccus]AQX15106.1 glycoside hydrolase family 43 [Tessaracoccus sp. T2.5-30]OCL36582.1 glycoside hydrolase family 43 [Tessaracoccus lapidicaptus]VEP39313.1 Extracellular endo-alpha-(1->5)-L-arabinanase 2 [Tessaracoccus lapidicaptus]
MFHRVVIPVPASRRSKVLAALAVGAALIGATPADAGPPAVTPPAPEFADATVHDPDHIEVDGVHYVFGSHLQVAKSDDLVAWEQVAEGVNDANPIFDDVTEELEEALAWAQSDTLWAPDVTQLPDGRFAMYYNACKGDSPRSAMGLAVADKVTGPYEDQGIFLKSGMWGEESEDGTVYDATVHPNVVDPDVFTDADGRWWMVYGSFSGGIFILELDPATGFPLPDQGYGTHLWGGNHARIEGPAVQYDAETGYYYLYVTYGGLDATGGYNVRVARSTAPDGPYVDMSGRDMAEVKADPTKPLFDDATIAPTAVKLMGNHEFSRVPGDPGTGRGIGYVSSGGSSPITVDGQSYLIFHTRFPGQGELHQVRVHEMFLDTEGWPVVAPLRYGGEASDATKRADAVGTWAVVDHAPKDIDTDVHRAQAVTLTQEGEVTGALTGTWERDGQSRILLHLDGDVIEAELSRQFDPNRAEWVWTFSGLRDSGAALWGVRTELVPPAEAVQRVADDLNLPDTTSTDLLLPTVGTQGSTIAWASSVPAVISPDGDVTRPARGEADAVVTLTATITNGDATAEVSFQVTVPARSGTGLVASYGFDGDLTGTLTGTGTVTGPKIPDQGGTITYAEGVTGQAAVFDGASGVRLPDGLVHGPTWSVSLWLNPAETRAFTTSFFAAQSTESWVSLLPEGHGGVGGNTMLWSGTAWYDADLGRRIPTNEWTHVAFTVDAGDVVAWLDGERVYEGAGFPDVLKDSTAVFALGVNWWDLPYRGLMDELRVYDDVLTDAQVAELAAG